MQKKLKSQFGSQQKKLVAQQKDLQSAVKNFEKNSAVMTDADKQKAQQKIIKQQQDLQKAQTDFRQQVGAAQNKAMQKIFAQVGKVVNKVAADQKLNLIVTKASAVYNDASMDVTDSVIKGLK
jgi:outer membrane protein